MASQRCSSAVREVCVLTVDIDVGGTLTDGIFSDNGRIACVKVDSTPHDLTVCLFDCLAQGAAQLGFNAVDDMLERVDLIRWSTTLTSNVLAERRGPNIGLLVSPGHEQDLYGQPPRSPLLDRFIPAGNVTGIDPCAEEAVIMSAVHSLLERGVRRISIAFPGSNRNPELEIRVKRVIDKQYPDHFLGSVPVLAGSDLAPGADDMTRTHAVLINAYTHGALAATLFKAEDELREAHRYRGMFLVSHINGGVSGIAKTKAMDTIESGPILGLHGASYLAKAIGITDAVALDVGGTTAKVGILRDAEPVVTQPSDWFGIPMDMFLPWMRSVALGGGSVVKTAEAGAAQPISLGPESMGSYPGPACYGLGGDEATVTDAFVAYGLINPGYFLGGAKTLDPELSRQAIDERVASRLNLSGADAAGLILDRAFQLVAGVISDALLEFEADLSRNALFAYGGNGGLFACGVAEKTGLDHVYFFPLGPVFSAFGSSVSSISHLYERALAAGADDDIVPRVRRALQEMKAEGEKDLLGEGIHPSDVTYHASVEVSANEGRRRLLALHEETLKSPHGLQSYLAAGGQTIETVRLRVRKAVAKPELAKKPLRGADASAALKGERAIAFGSKDGRARIYRWESLDPGNRVGGCAILEAANGTYFVPHGWSMVMDEYGNGKVIRG